MLRFRWRFALLVNDVGSFGFCKRQNFFFPAYYQVCTEDTVTTELGMALNTRDSVGKELIVPLLKRI